MRFASSAHVSGMVWASFPNTYRTWWAALQTGCCGISSVNKEGDGFPARRIYGLPAGPARRVSVSINCFPELGCPCPLETGLRSTRLRPRNPPSGGCFWMWVTIITVQTCLGVEKVPTAARGNQTKKQPPAGHLQQDS